MKTSVQSILEQDKAQIIHERYQDIYAEGYAQQENPVQKVPLVVSGEEGDVRIAEVVSTDADGNEVAGAGGG